MPSDFGAVWDYAVQLEASVPEAELAKLAAIRPASLGPTKKQREEMAKLAAMSPEDRAKAEEQAAKAQAAPAPAAAQHPAAPEKK